MDNDISTLCDAAPLADCSGTFCSLSRESGSAAVGLLTSHTWFAIRRESDTNKGEVWRPRLARRRVEQREEVGSSREAEKSHAVQ